MGQYKILFLIIFASAGIFLFQAQDFNGHKFNDNNPLIDQPTQEALSHWDAFRHDGELDVITDAQGFDNYEIGLDFAEQVVVTNPNNPLWIFTGVNASPQNAYWSTNGGMNWTLNNPGYPGGTCCDPWAAYTYNGTLIYGSGVSGQYVYISSNNGQTWTSPVLSVSGNDRNTLAADQTNGPYSNYAYAAITPGNFARSTNAGTSWTTTFSSSNFVPGVMIAVGPNGGTEGGCVIYVTNTGSTVPCIYNFHRSTDGGASFTANVSSISDAGYVGTLNSVGRLVINNARTRPYPMIAMDNSNGQYRGRLYCVYASNDPPGNGNKPDIILRYSTDQGSTWSARIKVNDDANSTTIDNWFPAVWCEKTTGKLYIKWYDTRENPASYTTGVWATYSTTGGTTFAPNQRVSNASFLYPCPACGSNQNCYRGDYDGITANAKVGYAVWWDPRNCNYQTMGGYFPDYAMKVQPASFFVNGTNDSGFTFVSIPAVKLYSDTVQFSATISPPPGTGTFTISFIDRVNNGITRNFLTTFPDSVRCRVKTSGGVTSGVYSLRIQSNGPNGTPVHVRTVSFTVNPTGTVTINNEIPDQFYLFQNFPNPFNPKTNIRYDIAKAGNVKLVVFDVAGKQVAELVNGLHNPGKYVYNFNASDFASGIYFYKLETPAFTSIKKMIFVK